MARPLRFLLAGGGSGGHVIPAIAVARELVKRGHEVLFLGTKKGMEAKLAPEAGFKIEWIEIGGLNRVGWRKALESLWQLPAAVLRSWSVLGRFNPAAVFSMGGYVAGPVVAAAVLQGTPVVAMEPNAMPGFTNRHAGRWCERILLSQAEAAPYFPAGRTEVIGYPVREEFFSFPAKAPGKELSVLITGGSQGSRRLNEAFRESWTLFRESGSPVRFLHQSGKPMFEALRAGFMESGLAGEVIEFIDDMPAAFAQADLVICRSGAGAVAELAAAGKAAILVPFPFAADDHQRHNAESMEQAGAASVVPDAEWTGERMFAEVSRLAARPAVLEAMSGAARRLSKRDAAARAAEVLEEFGRKALTRGAGSRNNVR